MKPEQLTRLEYEKVELDKKLNKLEEFLASEEVNTLDIGSATLLTGQADAMAVYARILSQRIALARRSTGTATWQALAFLSHVIKNKEETVEVTPEVAGRVTDIVSKLGLEDINVASVAGKCYMYNSFGSACVKE